MLWLWLAYNKNDGYEKDLRIEIKSERGIRFFNFPHRVDALPYIHHQGLSHSKIK